MARKRKQVSNAALVCRFRIASPDMIDEYREIARQYRYGKLSPFLRDLLEAARNGNPKTGMLTLVKGASEVSDAA